MIRRNAITGLMATVSFAAIGTAVYAQDTAAPVDDNVVVVTAQKREQKLQDVPVAITVASGKQLERLQVNSIADLQRIAPALEMQQASGQSVGGGGQVRGIGTQSFQSGATGSVAVVIDQVSQGNINTPDLFDISRVEVLKGPQGTLFGLTTSAGVINITTNKPELGRFSGRVRAELSDYGTAGSEYGQQVIQGLINVPLGETAALRVSASRNDRQGVNRNALTGKLDDHRTDSARARLLWQVNDRLTLNLIGEYAKVDDDGLDFFTIQKVANNAESGQVGAVLAACGITAEDGNRDYCSNTGIHNNFETKTVSAQVDYEFDNVTFTSITSSRKQDVGPNNLNIFRLDDYHPELILGDQFGKEDLFTQEFRLASPTGAALEYTVGAFFSDYKSSRTPQRFSVIVPGPVGLFRPVDNLGSAIDIEDESYAVFGQATWRVSDKLRLIAGARLNHETLSVDYVDYGSQSQHVVPVFVPTFHLTYVADTPVITRKSAEKSIDNVSVKLGAQYKFDSDNMGYLTVSRGYKGPQIAQGAASDPTPPTIIRPELPTAFEVGLKSTLAGGRVFTDLNAFYIDMKDYQGQVCVAVSTGGLNCTPTNIPQVISKGFEASISGRAAEGLNLNAGVIYNSATYPDGFVGGDGTNIGGTQLALAPKWKLNLGGEYSHNLNSVLDGFISFDATFKSKIRYDAASSPDVFYHAHWITGGRIGIRSLNSNWTLSLYGRNLGNEHEPVLRIRNFPDGSTGSIGQMLSPQSFRQVGISLDARF
ncbi:hypothetical protein ABAC460_22895 [Asticcacaulis sp. AC460]|uniref:TonB-dependent receptor n=1 Tax=Asticcacaulis sp. AC460 TaxID=1282360 RepID=UPI0003C3F6BF|nr:TonB-dependent receptor [Asticcacaulis sp. AC460]ESQ86679.1 hypothetical protein ABAC460_22895 [Asticcacaulis sp. AC460]